MAEPPKVCSDGIKRLSKYSNKKKNREIVPRGRSNYESEEQNQKWTSFVLEFGPVLTLRAHLGPVTDHIAQRE